MQRTRKNKPLGVCTVCRTPTGLHGDVNHRCRMLHRGRRCVGVYQSGLGVLWETCESCMARGAIRRQPCPACGGFGWRLVG